ncbi:transposase [Nonomuraea sp. NPDC001636]|uniref:transposase n=1 Tax=Nonomuraea sp. NPDC001636 TaxID=3154391 RepID=UPI003331882F
MIVTAASVQDRDGAHPLLARLREKFSTIALVWADGGYAGRLLTWARDVLQLTVTIVKRSDDLCGFVVLPRRWVAERTFAWLTRYRRLVRIYERKPEHHEAMIWWATVHQMTRRPRTGRPTASWPLGRPATASRPVQSRPARQGAGTPGRPAVASLERGRAGRYPRDRERQQLPRPAVPVVPPGLHQQARTSRLWPHAHEHLSHCQQALRVRWMKVISTPSRAACLWRPGARRRSLAALRLSDRSRPATQCVDRTHEGPNLYAGYQSGLSSGSI